MARTRQNRGTAGTLPMRESLHKLAERLEIMAGEQEREEREQS
jgi:hypothetical protein